ncbi:hypothetical protein CYMTET_42503 [Cymbomonas tetramitiformis]|uniref:Uncharacterized protein n=1 Tax=Cymbomonas tetramitiformis TaxID=36881 RepID=A0AAE0F1L3_9CHLO|nr:hypothetical protein CYMTET_42503 [Cymbomonas tetramitiformis]
MAEDTEDHILVRRKGSKSWSKEDVHSQAQGDFVGYEKGGLPPRFVRSDAYLHDEQRPCERSQRMHSPERGDSVTRGCSFTDQANQARPQAFVLASGVVEKDPVSLHEDGARARFRWAPDDRPAFVEQLPVVKVEALVQDAAPAPPSFKGAPNTLGGKAVRDVSYGTVQASKEEAPQTALEPAVEVVKQRAPTVKFGTSKKMAEAMVDERPVLQPNDELTRKKVPGVSWAQPVSAPKGAAKEEEEGNDNLLDPKYDLVQQARGAATFKGSERTFSFQGKVEPPPENGEGCAPLDLNAAYSSVLPRAAIAAFSKSSRFADAWDGAELRRKQPDGESKKEESVQPEAPSIAPDKLTRPRAPAVTFAPPRTEKAQPSAETEVVPPEAEGDVSYRLVSERVKGSAWAPPKVEDPVKKIKAVHQKVGPGAYEVKLSCTSTVRRPPAASFGSSTLTVPRRMTANTNKQRSLNVDTALAAVRPRAPGMASMAISKAPRFATPKEKLSGKDDPGTAQEVSAAGTATVKFTLVERRVVGSCAWRKPAAPLPPHPKQATASEAASQPAVAEAASVDVAMEELQLRRRAPAWGWSPASDSTPEPIARPLSVLNPNYDFARPSTAAAMDFGRTPGREQEEERKRKLPAVGQYTLDKAWGYLQQRLPGPVFRLASERWEGGVFGALLSGGEDAFLELQSCVELTRPAPPSWSFAPLVTTQPRRPLLDVAARQPALQVDYTLVRRRTPAAAPFGLLRGRSDAEVVGESLSADYKAEVGRYDLVYDLVEQRTTTMTLKFHHQTGRGIADASAHDYTESPLEGDVLDLDLLAAEELVLPQHPTAVKMDVQLPRHEVFSGATTTASIDLANDSIFAAVAPHVPGVDLAAGGSGPPEESDPQAWRRGPGTYRTEVAFGSDAVVVDFSKAGGHLSDEATKQ